MMPEQNEKMTSRVKKLLALAGNNPNEHEAEEAMLRAQALMAQYNIEMKSVEDLDEDEPIELGRTQETIAAYYKLRLAHVIAENFKVLVFTTKVGRGKAKRISFYGYKEDVSTAIEIFNFVLRVMEYNWWHLYYGKVDGNKKDYSMGFVNGLASRFADQVKKNGWGLVVQTPAAVREACEKNFKTVKSTSYARIERSDAYLYGADDGYKFDHNKKPLEA